MAQKRRAYDGSGRKAAAHQTRRAILDAAQRLFVERGYSATTMPAIAKAASVALDTVYASVGKKAALFRLLVELAISGQDQPVPALERAYVKEIAAAPDAARKLELYAAAVCAIQLRLAPLAGVLAEAAGHDEGLLQVWREITKRRAANMRLFARDLQATGELRDELSTDMVADILWSMNGSEYYGLLVDERRWPIDRYQAWLGDAWVRLFLKNPPTKGTPPLPR